MYVILQNMYNIIIPIVYFIINNYICILNM